MTDPRPASRIRGRGALLRSLQALVRRTERFGIHRAATDKEQRWATTFADGLDGVLRRAPESPGARASLVGVMRHAAVSAKNRERVACPTGERPDGCTA